MTILALPRYAVLKNKYNSKFLSYRKDDTYLDFKGEDITSSLSKFALEPASNGNGQVHVRCCYNNKYFVRNSSTFVVAGAVKPDEVTSNDTCTLFEPIAVEDGGDTDTIRLRHVQSGKYACLYYEVEGPHDAWLCAKSEETDESYMMDAFKIINWNSLVIFPAHSIAFKGSNGSYLKGVYVENHEYQQYAEDDKNSKRAGYQVITVGDGSVQVYSRYFDRYWSLNDSCWIWADRADKSPNDPNALFWPVKISDNVIALRSLGNNKFLRGIDGDNKTRCLNACEDTITDAAHITVEELVLSRCIYNIVYRQDDARVYNEIPIICGIGTAVNDSDQQDTMMIPVNYTEAKSTCWENSVSLTGGIKTSLEVGVPLISAGSIEVNVGITGEQKWGTTVDESFQTGITYTAVVGPRTQGKVTRVASQGMCDVPFSYSQEDLFSDGTRNITVKDDGVFTGVNCYDFSFKKQQEPIPATTD